MAWTIVRPAGAPADWLIAAYHFIFAAAAAGGKIHNHADSVSSRLGQAPTQTCAKT